VPLLLLCMLSACASAPDAINPVSWWHSLEGGPIAQKRALPPGAEAPFPNLANVPIAPSFLPAPERDRISAALLADRTRTEQQVLLEPLPSGTASDTGNSVLTQPPAPPPAEPSGASASLPAVTSQPAPAAPPASPPPPEPATVAAATATLPSVPLAPPPPPALAGIGLPGPPPAPYVAGTEGGLDFHFATGSSALSAGDRARLAAFAHRRGGAGVAVIGFGDATESEPAAQSAGLQLGLARAEAVAAALAASGVPESALRLGAEASGAGAVAAFVR